MQTGRDRCLSSPAESHIRKKYFEISVFYLITVISCSVLFPKDTRSNLTDSEAVFPRRINRITAGCMQRVKKYIHNLNTELKCVYDMKDGEVVGGSSGRSH